MQMPATSGAGSTPSLPSTGFASAAIIVPAGVTEVDKPEYIHVMRRLKEIDGQFARLAQTGDQLPSDLGQEQVNLWRSRNYLEEGVAKAGEREASLARLPEDQKAAFLTVPTYQKEAWMALAPEEKVAYLKMAPEQQVRYRELQDSRYFYQTGDIVGMSSQRKTDLINEFEQEMKAMEEAVQ